MFSDIGFTESQKLTKKVETSQNSRNQNEEPIQEKRKTTKTSLVVIGTSNIKHIEPQRWSKYTTRKITAYTIEDAINAIGTLKEKADVVVFHSLTNDIKHMTPDECTTKMLDLLEKTKNKSSDTKIIISLATPRSDREEWNINQELVNAMLKQNLRGKQNVSISENSNLAYHGHPRRGLVEKDGIHLTKDGAAILAANLKRSIDTLCDNIISRDRKPGHMHERNQRDYSYRPRRGQYYMY